MSILIGSASIIMLFLALYTGAKKVESMELERSQIEKMLVQSQMLGRTMEEKIKEISRYRHDLKGFLDTISYMDGTGSMNPQHSSADSAEENIPYSSDPLIDAILRQKERQCAENGIPFTCNTYYPGSGDEVLSPEDKASIIQNLLTNAVEANLALQENSEKGLTVQIREENGFYLCVRNRIETGKPIRLHTRKDPRLHGIGLQVVERIVQEAGGKIRILPDETNGWISVIIEVH